MNRLAETKAYQWFNKINKQIILLKKVKKY